MAKYFKVLNTVEKTADDNGPSFFANVDENRTIQYVITPDDQQAQAFHTQQIVLSTDQLMVVDQQQQVIIDPSQIKYQAQPEQQVIIQDVNAVDFQNGGAQQIFYMDSTGTQFEPIITQEQELIQTQPIVLNPCLNQNLIRPKLPQTIQQQIAQQQQQRQIPIQRPVNTLQQQNRGVIANFRATLPQRVQLKTTLNPPPPPNKVVQQQSNISQQVQGCRKQVINQRVQQAVEFPTQNFKTTVSTNTPNDMGKHNKEVVVNLPDGPTPQFKPRVESRIPVQNRIETEKPPPLRKPRNAPGTPRNTNRALPKSPKSARGARAAVNQPIGQPRYILNNQPQQLKEQLQQRPIPQQFNQLQQQQTSPQPNHLIQPAVRQPQQSQANYVIQPPHVHQKPPKQSPLPSYIPSSQIQQIIESTPISEEDSIRMLVLLANGEQRLITFTLPKEACTIQEILEQVNVPFQHDTNIQVTEANTNGINYIVTVGNVPNFGYNNQEGEEFNGELADQDSQSSNSSQTKQNVSTPEELSKEATPELVKELTPPDVPRDIPPKLVPGKLALCSNCGYLSEDFNKCLRCKRKLADNVKAIPATATTNGRKFVSEKKLIQLKTNSAKQALRKKAKPKLMEHETVVLSSDDEDDEEKKMNKLVNDQILQKLGSSVTISPVTKEPSITDIQRHSKAKVAPTTNDTPTKFISTSIECRTIRIGSYRFIPPEKIYIDSKGITMKVPHPSKENEILPLKVDKCDIVKVLVSFNKALPVVFYYLNPSVGVIIREMLSMVKNGDFYYDPLSEREESHRRITLLPDEISDEDKTKLEQIYGAAPHNIMDELTAKEANDILIKTCPKELSKNAIGSFTEIKQLLMYPPEGRGRISINTEDYVCLAADQFLNDVIIDFYLKYLVDNLPVEQRETIHVFSTFFYKRLTSKPYLASRRSQPTELDPNLTAAEKRHARVRTWTKNVNLFEKDFVIVPINENAHWFLAIICFPGMTGSQTFDGKPYTLEPRQVKKKKVTKLTVAIEEVEAAAMADLSDKDEAEGDDSDLESDDSDDSLPTPPSRPPTPIPAPVVAATPKLKTVRPPIKQPCILIFDSLAGASRCRVVATLRDYLTCEYKAKLNKEKQFNKDNIKGACPKVPQQTNFTDCGLYVLQYVEQFFIDPIKDYYIPINHLKNWFEEITVTKKREDISVLIKQLMKQYGKDLRLIPEIMFPTQNGKLVECEFDDEEEEDMFEDIGESFVSEEECAEGLVTLENVGPMDTTPNTSSEEATDSSAAEDSPMKPSIKGASIKADFVQQTVANTIKPDISSEITKTESNRDTLSYLKAKRIIRHKNSDGPDQKKTKNV